MSLRVVALCRSRKFRTHTIKHVIKEMADRASDDGSGVWCSKQTLANDTGLSKDAVRKAVKELLANGFIVETGKRRHSNFYTKVYRIVLAEVELLPTYNTRTGCSHHPVQGDMEATTGCKRTSSLGDDITPNRPKTIQEPLSNGESISSDEVEEYFQLAWMAYPDDRKTKQSKCRKEFFSAVEDGADPEGILRAVQTYEMTSRTYTRSMVKLAHNWFSNRDWIQFIEKEAIELQGLDDAMRASLDLCAQWINEGSRRCALISPKQIRALLDAGRVTRMQLVRVGLEHKAQECGDS